MPIFDQGYQHFHGQLSGNAWRWWVIARHGVRTQMKNVAVRILLLLSWVPALALVVVLALWGLVEQQVGAVTSLFGGALASSGLLSDPVTYRGAVWTLAYSFFFSIQLFLIMLLVVAVGPGLISRDLRFNALPLYFARPVSRLDYFLGKLAVIAALVAAVAVVPALLAYVMGVCFSLDVTVIRDTYRLPLASIAYGLLVAVAVGTLMLAMSSLTRRSIIVGIAWFGLWVISGTVASTLEGFHTFALLEQAQRESAVSAVPPLKEGKVSPAEIQRRQQAQQGSQQRWQELLAESARTNWRPLFSLRANMHRLGEGLLGSDAAWVDVARAMNAPQRLARPAIGQQPAGDRWLADAQTPQYPWYWSAGVLAALCALSVGILTFRIKTLDRLK